MKELSIEEKAKRYDEAISIAREYDFSLTGVCAGDVIQDIFPELKESEDERIRQEIIDYLIEHDVDGYLLHADCEKWVAWLENQAKQKFPIEKLPSEMKTIEESLGFTTQEECDRYNQMVSDLIMSDDKVEQKSAYTKEYDFHGIKFIPKFAKGDIIKDKKCGEVSTIKDFSYDTGLYTHTYGQFPITIQDNYEIIAQKTSWSEEDRRKLSRIYSILRQAADTHAFSTTCRLIGDKECIELQDFLRSIIQQPRQEFNEGWKPSDEQMKALNEAIYHVDDSIATQIAMLIRDLKKL